MCIAICPRLVLNEAKGKASHVVISKLQSAALVQVINDAEITVTERADLTVAISKLEWCNVEDQTHALSALADFQVEPAKKKGRRAQQNFTTLVQYGTEAFWHDFTSIHASPAAKLHVLLEHAAKVGLRCPSEPTIKMLTSMWLVAAHSRSELQSFDRVTKMTFKDHVKDSFDSYRRRLSAPLAYVEVLPEDVATYMREYGGMWKAVLGTAMPVSPGLDAVTLLTFDNSYACRGGRGSVMEFGQPTNVPSSRGQPSGSAIPIMGLSPRRGECAALERMATTFMAQMNMASTFQQKMLEMMMGQPGGGNLRSLATLTSGGSSLERRPTIAFSAASESDPVSPTFLRICELDQSPAPAGSAHDASPVQAAPPQVDQSTSQQLVHRTADGFDGDLEAMLTALDDRKREKTNALKEAKKSKKVEPAPIADGSTTKSPDTGAAKSDATDVAKVTKAASKAKAKKAKTAKEAKKAATSESYGADVPKGVVADKGAKPKATVPSETVADVEIKPKCATKPKGKAKPVAKEGAAGLVLGCTKCRWSTCGCGQCKNPAYTGTRWNRLV